MRSSTDTDDRTSGQQARRETYVTPVLLHYGSLQALTAGGSAAQVSEFWNCNNQQLFFRC